MTKLEKLAQALEVADIITAPDVMRKAATSLRLVSELLTDIKEDLERVRGGGMDQEIESDITRINVIL